MTAQKKRVLVAEDNAALARVVQFNLQRSKMGIEATVAPDGLAAWNRASDEQFDAVITDQQMPEMTGVELLQKLRTLPNYAEVPLVMLTAKGLELELPKLLEDMNVSAIFAKPFSPSHVVSAVEELLSA